MKNSTTSPPEVFHLIKTLSPVEKRNYRRFAGKNDRKGQNNYLKLFDLLDKMEQWDPDLLASRLERLRFGTHYRSTRLRLMKNLLHFLRLHQEVQPIERSLQEQIAEIEILLQRGLYKSCMKLHRKAVKLATQHELYTLLLQLSDLEKRLFFRIKEKALLPELAELANRDRDWLERLENSLHFQHLSLEAHSLAKLKHYRGQGNADDPLASLQQRLDPAAAAPPVTVGAQLAFRNARGQVALMSGSAEAAHEEFSALLTLWQAHPERVTEQVSDYLITLVSFLNSCIISRRFDAFETYLQQVESLPVQGYFDKLRLQENLFSLQLVYFLNIADFERGVALEGPIEEMVAANPVLVPAARVLGYYHNLSMLYFLKGDFSGALRWANRIINERQRPFRKDIRDLLRLLRLPLHFEIGDYDLLEYLLRANRRYFNANPQPLGMDKLLMGLFSDWLKTGELEVFPALCAQLRTQFDELKNQLTGPPPPGFMEIYCWLSSQAEQQPISTIFEAMVRG